MFEFLVKISHLNIIAIHLLAPKKMALYYIVYVATGIAYTKNKKSSYI